MDVRSNKKQIKDAVARLYDIQTRKINTLIRCARQLALAATREVWRERGSTWQ